MKRLFKNLLKAPWRWAAPIRRPVLRKVEAFLRRSLRPTEMYVIDESNALMDQVVRELVRLQRQVECLQQAIEDLAAEREGPAIAGEIEPADRLKAC